MVKDAEPDRLERKARMARASARASATRSALELEAANKRIKELEAELSANATAQRLAPQRLAPQRPAVRDDHSEAESERH
jgi:hypothetical protein